MSDSPFPFITVNGAKGKIHIAGFGKQMREAARPYREAAKARDEAAYHRVIREAQREVARGQREVARGQREAARVVREAARVEREAARAQREAARAECIALQINDGTSVVFNDFGGDSGGVRTFTDAAEGHLQVPSTATVIFRPEGGMRWFTPGGSTYRASDISGVLSINGMDPADYRRAMQASMGELKKAADPLEGLRDASAQPLSDAEEDEDKPEPPDQPKKRKRRFTRKRAQEDAKEGGKEDDQPDDPPPPPPPLKKRKKDTADEEERGCVVCMANKRAVCFVPCGHVSCCPDCVRKLPRPLKCPECRTKVDRAQFLYL